MERNNSLESLIKELKLNIIDGDIEKLRDILDKDIIDLENIKDIEVLKTAMGLYKLAHDSLKEDNKRILKEMKNISRGIALNNATTKNKAYGLYNIVV